MSFTNQWWRKTIKVPVDIFLLLASAFTLLIIVIFISVRPSKISAKVVRVIDGDTVEIAGGRKVRYLGIDAPETVDPSKPVGCFGPESASENEKQVEGKEVLLEKDTTDTDKYGRLLRYVWVGDMLVNEILVRGGFARADSFWPDIKYQDQIKSAQSQAKSEKKGLWGKICSP